MPLLALLVTVGAAVFQAAQAPPTKYDGTWIAHVKAAPIEGKANEELIALVAGHFQCRRAAVSIKSGASGRLKLVRIEGT